MADYNGRKTHNFNVKERNRLIDIALDIQNRYGYISWESMEEIAGALEIPLVEVRDAVTFYSFLSTEPQGKNIVRLTDAAIENMSGADLVARAFESQVGVPFGATSEDGSVTLDHTACIGMSDQPPSALINGIPVTRIRPEEVSGIVEELQNGSKYSAERLINDDLASLIEDNLRLEGPVIFAPAKNGAAVRAALNLSPEGVIDAVTKSGLRGRGGAGFPTGMKWRFCRGAKATPHYLICNADEGEPGTFKDRVLLNRVPDLIFEGMTIGAYAIGAEEGFLYLRGEFAYLKNHLEAVLERRRHVGLLGEHIGGRDDFSFDIRIQLGAGAYVCGEESGLIESLEGKRGAPRDRPPFPVTKGYKGLPTAVNNVETFCCAARILENGAEWFTGFGSKDSTGTKLLSISGDCESPGVYEIEYGLSIDDMLTMAGARNVQAVQVGGASGSCVAPKDFGRTICFNDIPTGGSVMIFSKDRDLLNIVRDLTKFFVDESCGWCAPCRAGNPFLLKLFDKVLHGRGCRSDLAKLENLGGTIGKMSRCGLGQTAPNPILMTLKNFPHLYNAKVSDEFIPLFDYERAIADGIEVAGRPPVHE